MKAVVLSLAVIIGFCVNAESSQPLGGEDTLTEFYKAVAMLDTGPQLTEAVASYSGRMRDWLLCWCRTLEQRAGRTLLYCFLVRLRLLTEKLMIWKL